MNYPEWVIKAADKLKRNVIFCEKIQMGVVADVWIVVFENKEEYIFKKTYYEKTKAKLISDQLSKICGFGFMPQEYSVILYEDSIEVTYKKIQGTVLEVYDQQVILDLVKVFRRIHTSDGFTAMPSIYHNIHVYAEEIVNNYTINECIPCIDTVIYAAQKILKKLDSVNLRKMLDCRGYLTHGDVKPNNTIIDSNNNVHLIDWEKQCSVSPEFDLIYMFFSGSFELRKQAQIYKFYNMEIIKNCIEFISCLFLVYDFYIFSKTNTRYEYITQKIMPMVLKWNEGLMKTYIIKE